MMYFCTFLLLLLLTHVPKSNSIITTADFYPYGAGAHDAELQQQCTSVITTCGFFLNTNTPPQGYKQAHICKNGLITFVNAITGGTPVPCFIPGSGTTPFIASFWADSTTACGHVWFRRTQDVVLLTSLSSKVNNFGAKGFTFTAKEAIVATWEDVTPNGSPSCDPTTLKNSFQTVVVTDGSHTFVIILFAKIEWTTTYSMLSKDALVGFDAGDQKTLTYFTESCTSTINDVTTKKNVAGLAGGELLYLINDISKYCCTNSHPICCTDGCAPAGYSCCSGGGACPNGWHCCSNGYCCYGETDGTGQPQSESSKLSIASQLKYSLESCASGAHCCPAGFLCCQNNCVQVPISTACSSSQLAMTYPGVILQDLNSAVKWLIKVEGLATKGFCPKPTSGLTIGLGVDMGQQNSDQDLRNNFTPDCLIARLRTFYGAKCSDPCYNPNTGVVSLTLTTSEATVLSTGFIVAIVKEVAPYGNHMSQNGLDVLASLAHWAGHICGYTCPWTFSQDYKLCIPYTG